MKTKEDRIDEIKICVRQAFKDRHFTNRRWNMTVMDEIRRYIQDIRRIQAI